MAFTYGFYNALIDENGKLDRAYDARQMSEIFDGIINDGVYMSVGTQFRVVATDSMTVNVGIGRAWFNNTWSLNDAIMPLTLEPAEVLQPRIDTVVIDVNHMESERKNEIKIIKGTPSSNPVAPTLAYSDVWNQHPLAEIYVGPNVTSIYQANITNRVGSSLCPFVTGIIETINTDELVVQWKDQWDRYFENAQNNWITQTGAWSLQWNTWFENERVNITTEMANWRDNRQNTWDQWFADLQAMLEPDVAANMAAEILSLKSRVTKLEEFQLNLSTDFSILSEVTDSAGGLVLDNLGNPVNGRILFVIKETSDRDIIG